MMRLCDVLLTLPLLAVAGAHRARSSAAPG